jgi:FixJ family two-component response regulator
MSDHRPTIFVVDDDLSVRRALDLLLRAAGYTVETFASASEFLERADLTASGCLVLDVRMPGESGFDLQEILTTRGHDIRIIFITGHGDIPMAVRAMKTGAVDFLTKPFDDQALLDAIEHALSRLGTPLRPTSS